MSKATKSVKKKEAPSMSVPDKKVGGKHRIKDKKSIKQEKQKMNNQFNKALFGVTYLILKVCLIVAGIALWKMPYVNLIWEIPFYQIIGTILLLFLVYLELYSYFCVKQNGKKPNKQKTALDKFKLNYEEV